tara:strand:+ start:1561 stop:1938 length:378 start_codon:yes stop_codon:yes gene_type:complete
MRMPWTKHNNELTSVKDALAQVLDRLDRPEPVQEDFDGTSAHVSDLRLRVEQLELSNEQLREECLRHLRKASQRLKRAEQVAEDEQLDDESTPQQLAQLPFPEQADQDDLSWARDQIRRRGDVPI